MSLLPGKIVLKSSTSKSLSDRFGELAKKSTVENIRGKQRQESTASIKNKRLAANMAKRLGDAFDETLTSSDRKPVKTRLGLSLANRLGNQGQPGQGRQQQTSTGNASARTRGSFRGRRGTRGRGGFGQRGTGRGGRGGRGGSTNQGTKRGRGVVGSRGGAKRGITRGKATTRGGRGRGRGAANGKSVTQAQLDKELDQYMSKTKSALNADLDQYMNAVSK